MIASSFSYLLQFAVLWGVCDGENVCRHDPLAAFAGFSSTDLVLRKRPKRPTWTTGVVVRPFREALTLTGSSRWCRH